jgi:transposase
MYTVELYVKVRRAVMVEGKSEREVARFFGIHRQSVKKMCAYSAPPGHRRPKSTVSPKLAPFVPIIDAILAADRTVHRKQLHTATRILERLRDEHGFTGGYTIVREYVNGVALGKRCSCRYRINPAMRRWILAKPTVMSGVR